MPGDYEEHWYEVVENDSLRQGDILRGLTVYWYRDGIVAGEEAPASNYADIDGIIATPSCDLDNRRTDHIVIAGINEATWENLRAPNERDFPAFYESHRKGLVPHRFFLPDTVLITPAFPASIVESRTLLTLPFGYVLRHASGTRHLRLRSPLREKFGNWIGSRFSDVGPEDVANVPRLRPTFPAHWNKAAENNP